MRAWVAGDQFVRDEKVGNDKYNINSKSGPRTRSGVRGEG